MRTVVVILGVEVGVGEGAVGLGVEVGVGEGAVGLGVGVGVGEGAVGLGVGVGVGEGAVGLGVGVTTTTTSFTTGTSFITSLITSFTTTMGVGGRGTAVAHPGLLLRGRARSKEPPSSGFTATRPPWTHTWPATPPPRVS